MNKFAERPFFFLSLLFGLGCFLASISVVVSLLYLGLLLFLFFLLVVFLCALKNRFWRIPVLSIVVIFAGFIICALQLFQFHYLEKDASGFVGKIIRIEGRVASYPVYHAEKNSWVFICDVRNAYSLEDNLGRKQKILISIKDCSSEITFNKGDYIAFSARCYKPNLPLYPFGYDYKRYLALQGIFLQVTLQNEQAITVFPQKGLSFVSRLASFMRTGIEKVIAPPVDNSKYETEQQLLRAMILGDRGRIPSAVKSSFIRTNTMHILAISGLHVAIIVLVLLTLGRLLMLPVRWRYGLTILFLLIYIVVTGGRPSVLRSVIMLSSILFGRLLGRRTDILNNVGFSACILLAVEPLLLFNPGFQLSYMTLISIIYLVPLITKRELQPAFVHEKSVFSDLLTKMIAVSFAACVGSLPLVVYYFSTISPYAVVTNIAAVLLLYGILGSAFIAIIIGQILPILGTVLCYISYLIIRVLLAFITAIEKLPLAVILSGDLSVGIIIFFYCVIIIGSLVIIKRKWLGIFILCVPLCMLLIKGPIYHFMNRNTIIVDAFSIRDKSVYVLSCNKKQYCFSDNCFAEQNAIVANYLLYRGYRFSSVSFLPLSASEGDQAIGFTNVRIYFFPEYLVLSYCNSEDNTYSFMKLYVDDPKIEISDENIYIIKEDVQLLFADYEELQKKSFSCRDKMVTVRFSKRGKTVKQWK